MPFDRMIPRAQIRPPSEPLRASMDDAFLERLTESIRRVGLLLPLVVEPYGTTDAVAAAKASGAEFDRFLENGGQVEILDGHQRYVASEKAGMHLLRCSVLVDEGVSKHMVMLHGNIMRKDVTPAEEGWQFMELATKHNWSMDDLVREFGVSENYINDRCELVQKDPVVAVAVHEGKLNLSQAKQLLKVKNPSFRLYLFDQATVHGATARTLEVMRQNKVSEEAAAQSGLYPHTAENSPAPDPAAAEECIWCGQSHDPENFRRLTVHWYHIREVMAIIDKVAIKHVLREGSQ
jgi:ParB-like chromosome segregation protein Spo0J